MQVYSLPIVGKKEHSVQQFILRKPGTDFTIHLVFSYLTGLWYHPHHLSVNKVYKNDCYHHSV